MEKVVNYSFIIPHKNCPNLLQRCVNSIPERDDVQVIVVDDNSDEGMKPSLKERNNLQVILLDAEQSKGAGRARNIGIEYAKGKWLLFADSDDYYSFDSLTSLLYKYEKNDNIDLVYLNASIINEMEKVTPFRTDKLIKDYLNGIKGAEMELRYSIWTPWSRMVKRELVKNNHIKFDEIAACNDKMFCLSCSRCARSIAAEDIMVYYYYKSTRGSITDKQRNHLMLDGLLDIRGRTIELYKTVGYRPLPAFIELVFFTKYTKGLTIMQVFSKYRKVLTRYHRSMIIDISCYFKKRLLY